jgi:hypothetical protein
MHVGTSSPTTKRAGIANAASEQIFAIHEFRDGQLEAMEAIDYEGQWPSGEVDR